MEITEQVHRLEVARAALDHGRRCPAGEPVRCPRFWSISASRMNGLDLQEGHEQAHGAQGG